VTITTFEHKHYVDAFVGADRVYELKELAITGNKALEQAVKEYHAATDEPFIKLRCRLFAQQWKTIKKDDDKI
jgi:hypothetical protein